MISGKTFSTVFLILVLTFCSCTELEELSYPKIPEEIQLMETRYGKKLEDPYAMHNIRKALESLKAAGMAVPDKHLVPNRTYLRFFPADQEELSLLENDSTLILFDHPLNYESPEAEEDIEAPEPGTGWYYCVVPYGKPLPPVHHELIYDVFIPDDNDFTTRSTMDNPDGFYESLVDESMRLTGNLPAEDTSSMQARGLFSPRWCPAGRIRVWDDLLDQYIPLQHSRVHARWFTRIETGFTDEEGLFKMKGFRHEVHYSIKWENSSFSIRNGNFLQAWYNGPRKKGEWNLDIRGGRSLMYATIHRAAFKHFYGENLGMIRPVLKSGTRTKISYMDEDGTGEFTWSRIGTAPSITVWGKSGGEYRATNEVFATTAHELGHQAHYTHIGHSRYGKTSKIIRESWAEAVEWSLSNDEYHSLGRKYNNNKALSFNHHYHIHSRWPDVGERDYSPVFIDLADNLNQRLIRGPKYPNDMITGYSMEFINNILLMNITDIATLRDILSRNKIEGVDDYMIKELLLLY